jgi:hypothetical protein
MRVENIDSTIPDVPAHADEPWDVIAPGSAQAKTPHIVGD